VLLALLAAILFAVSAALQHHSAGVHGRRLAAEPGILALEERVRLPLQVPAIRWPRALLLLGRLVRDRWWLLGWLASVAGFAAQAAALHLGSIVAVQAVIVTQMVFALPLTTVPAGRAPLRQDWLGSASVCIGLVILLFVRGVVAQTTGRRFEVWWIAGVAAVLILSLLRAAKRLDRCGQRQYRTGAVAIAAGICFCMTAAFLVLVSADVVHRGVPAGLLNWPLLGLCTSTFSGMLLVQDAFAGGSLPAAMTAMVVTDVVASWITGTVLFDARPRLDGATLLGSALAVGFIVLGVVAMANSPTFRERYR
jgi:hypothetical protein